MKDEFDNRLKKAMRPSQEPDFWLNQKVINNSQEDKKMMKKGWKRTTVTVGAVGLLLLSSVGITASVRYFNAKQVAEQVEDNKLAKAFDSKDAVSGNETQQVGGYDITFVGMVSGNNLSDYVIYEDNGDIRSDRTYAVVAIAPSDGTKMQEKDEDGYNISYTDQFFVSPFIEGYNPNLYNAYYFNGGATSFVQDGVLYWVLETDNLEVFANHTIYLGVTESLGAISEAYTYQEDTGMIDKNETYSGVDALFTLPMDKSKGSDEAAEAYLKSLEEDDTEDIEETEDAEFYDTWTEENIDEYATVEKSTVQTLTPDKDGYISWNWELEDGSSQETIWIDGYETGKLYVTGCAGEGEAGSLVDTLIRNEDGTVTVAVYRVK